MFKQLVNEEKVRAREANGKFNSMHEIYGVLMEEVDEFFDQVKIKPNERDPENTLSELVQVAAVAEMAAEDLQLVENDIDQAFVENRLLNDVREFVNNSQITTISGGLQKNFHNILNGTKGIVVPMHLFDRLKEWAAE